MAEAARRLATWEDLLKTQEGLTYEIIAGELEALPRPAPRHAHAQWNLASELGPPFGRGRGGPGGWWFLVEPGR